MNSQYFFLFQYPEPVRVHAFTATVLENAVIKSKTTIPIPIQAPASTPILDPESYKNQALTEEARLPIRVATKKLGRSNINMDSNNFN